MKTKAYPGNLIYQAIIHLLVSNQHLAHSPEIKNLSKTRLFSELAIEAQAEISTIILHFQDLNQRRRGDPRLFFQDKLTQNLGLSTKQKSLTELAYQNLTQSSCPEDLAPYSALLTDVREHISRNRRIDTEEGFLAPRREHPQLVALLLNLLINALVYDMNLDATILLTRQQRHILHRHSPLHLRQNFIPVFHLIIMSGRMRDLRDYLLSREASEINKLKKCHAGIDCVLFNNRDFHSIIHTQHILGSPAYLMAYYHNALMHNFIHQNNLQFIFQRPEIMQKKYKNNHYPCLGIFLLDYPSQLIDLIDLATVAERCLMNLGKAMKPPKDWMNQSLSASSYAAAINWTEKLSGYLEEAWQEYLGITSKKAQKVFAYYNFWQPLIIANKLYAMDTADKIMDFINSKDRAIVVSKEVEKALRQYHAQIPQHEANIAPYQRIN